MQANFRIMNLPHPDAIARRRTDLNKGMCVAITPQAAARRQSSMLGGSGVHDDLQAEVLSRSKIRNWKRVRKLATAAGTRYLRLSELAMPAEHLLPARMCRGSALAGQNPRPANLCCPNAYGGAGLNGCGPSVLDSGLTQTDGNAQTAPKTTQWTKPDRARWKVLSTRVSSFSRKLGPLSNHRAGLHWPKFNMIEAWRVSQLPDADVKIVIYRAFVEGELEAPKQIGRAH